VNARPSVAALACALALPLGAAALARAQTPEPETQLDVRAPRLELGGRRVQPLAPRFEAFGSCDEPCEFEASARVHGVPGLSFLRVITPSKASEGGTQMRFHLHVTPRAHKLMNDALRDGRRVRVEVTVAAYDLAENETEGRRWIRVRPLVRRS
jgi:hypothetical protein